MQSRGARPSATGSRRECEQLFKDALSRRRFEEAKRAGEHAAKLALRTTNSWGDAEVDRDEAKGMVESAAAAAQEDARRRGVGVLTQSRVAADAAKLTQGSSSIELSFTN